MDITTSLPAPSSSHRRKVLITLELKLVVVIALSLFFSSSLPSALSSFYASKENDLENGATWTISIIMNDLYQCLRWVSSDLLPRVVAASLAYHIGFCCLFVGLVHLKWIMPK